MTMMPDMPTQQGVEAFFKAVRDGRLEGARAFLDQYPDYVDVRDRYEATALTFAAQEGLADMAALLLDRGADVDAAGKNKVTPLMWAAESDHVEVVNLLLEKGAGVNHCDDLGETALMMAALNEAEEVINVLLAHGAEVNIKEKDGKTALDYARDMACGEDEHDGCDHNEKTGADNAIVAMLESRLAAEENAAEISSFSPHLKRPMRAPKQLKPVKFRPK